jgi:hypothetical protein
MKIVKVHQRVNHVEFGLKNKLGSNGSKEVSGNHFKQISHYVHVQLYPTVLKFTTHNDLNARFLEFILG